MGTSTLRGAVNVAGVINKKPFGIGRTSVRASCETVQNGLVPAARRMGELIDPTAVMSASALSYSVEIAIATESEAPRGRVAVEAGEGVKNGFRPLSRCARRKFEDGADAAASSTICCPKKISRLIEHQPGVRICAVTAACEAVQD